MNKQRRGTFKGSSGWVLKYLFAYITGQGVQAAADGYFSGFISNHYEPLICLAVFLIARAFVLFRGVSGGPVCTS